MGKWRQLILYVSRRRSLDRDTYHYQNRYQKNYAPPSPVDSKEVDDIEEEIRSTNCYRDSCGITESNQSKQSGTIV